MSNLYVVSGDAYLDERRLVVTVTEPVLDADGNEISRTPVDLSATDLTFMVKRRRSDADADALITKTTVSGIEIATPQTGATKGVAYIELDEADTDDLGHIVGGYPWELEGEDSVGKVTLASGRFYVTADLVMAP